LEKRNHGRIQGLAKFFEYPLLFQEQVKLRTSNVADTFTGSFRTKKTIKNFGRKGVWAYPGTAQFFWIPPVISGTDEATNFKFCRYIHRSIRTKALKSFGEKGAWAYPGTAQNF